MNRNIDSKGFIGTIVIVVIGLALLKYFFDWNIIEFLKSPKVIETFYYIKKFIVLIWDKFVATPASFLWNDIVINIIWKTIVEAFNLLKHWVNSQG